MRTAKILRRPGYRLNRLVMMVMTPLCMHLPMLAADEPSSKPAGTLQGAVVKDARPELKKSVPGEVVHRRLESGPLLLSPEDDTVLETPFGSVSVAADSLTLIVAAQNALSVYDLHDGSKNAILITDSHKVDPTIPLIPGHMIALAGAAKSSFEEINVAQFVRYRLLTDKLLPSQHKLYEAQFDLLSLMHGLPALKKLLDSDNAKTRKVMQHTLKTAVIMDQISPSSEPYRYYLPAETRRK